jgi:hypothetical protein
MTYGFVLLIADCLYEHVAPRESLMVDLGRFIYTGTRAFQNNGWMANDPKLE